VKVIMGTSGSGDNVTFEVPAAVVIPWERRWKAAAPLKAQNYTFMRKFQNRLRIVNRHVR
jgi:hypothetical protein